jgi:succinate dehydrogenase/fumarate reductase cytochrome b subunit
MKFLSLMLPILLPFLFKMEKSAWKSISRKPISSRILIFLFLASMNFLFHGFLGAHLLIWLGIFVLAIPIS